MGCFFSIVSCLIFFFFFAGHCVWSYSYRKKAGDYNMILSIPEIIFFSFLFHWSREHWQPFICLKPFLHFIFLMPFSPGDCPSYFTMCSVYIFSADPSLFFWLLYVELAQGSVSGSVFFLCLLSRCSYLVSCLKTPSILEPNHLSPFPLPLFW